MAGTLPTQQPADSVTLKSAHHADKWENSAYFAADGVLFDMVSCPPASDCARGS